MADQTNSKDTSMVKAVVSNLPRAGLLAIPGIGSAIEKAVFGPLDDIAREEDRRAIHDALDELKVDADSVVTKALAIEEA